jgi:hypothetical protein
MGKTINRVALFYRLQMSPFGEISTASGLNGYLSNIAARKLVKIIDDSRSEHGWPSRNKTDPGRRRHLADISRSCLIRPDL